MSDEKKRWKSILSFTLKIGLSVAALVIVFRKVDLRQIGEVLSNSQWLWFVPAILLVAGSKILAAFRLNVFFKAIGLQLSERMNLQLYWVGMYYNLFLPGGIGGDAYKIFLLRQQGQGNIRDLVLATLSDRAIGLLALFIMALGMTPWLDTGLWWQTWLPWGIPLLIGFAWIALRIIKRSFLPVFWSTLGWSVGVQGLQVIAVICLLVMIGQSGSWLGFLFLFLLSSVLTALPISYGGAGAREIAFYFGATHLGLPEAPAVSISLLFYLCSLFVSLSGMRYSFKKLTVQ
jgi:uncharacterized membrane protein YbhN (UPF0104 family)